MQFSFSILLAFTLLVANAQDMEPPDLEGPPPATTTTTLATTTIMSSTEQQSSALPLITTTAAPATLTEEPVITMTTEKPVLTTTTTEKPTTMSTTPKSTTITTTTKTIIHSPTISSTVELPTTTMAEKRETTTQRTTGTQSNWKPYIPTRPTRRPTEHTRPITNKRVCYYKKQPAQRLVWSCGWRYIYFTDCYKCCAHATNRHTANCRRVHGGYCY